jgi:hypothetical protein
VRRRGEALEEEEEEEKEEKNSYVYTRRNRFL